MIKAKAIITTILYMILIGLFIWCVANYPEEVAKTIGVVFLLAVAIMVFILIYQAQLSYYSKRKERKEIKKAERAYAKKIG